MFFQLEWRRQCYHIVNTGNNWKNLKHTDISIQISQDGIKWKKGNNVIKCLIPPKLIRKFMAVFILFVSISLENSIVIYNIFWSYPPSLPFNFSPPWIFLFLFPSFYFLYNPWSSVGAALVCMDVDVGPSTSHIPEEKTSSPSPGSHPLSEALGSSPLTPAGMLTGSVLLPCPADSGQWVPELRESVASRRHHFTVIPPISGSHPCLLVQRFLSLVDREDRDVPHGAGYPPLPLVLGTEPSHGPVAATVSGGKGCSDGSGELHGSLSLMTSV